ncbi:MAG: hypothetical protein AAGF49_13145 [Pseudomonadota bacterium]
MYKTLYLHIGSQKTGSSSIQMSFYRNRRRLARAGVIYPGVSPNHASLISHARPGSFRAGSLRTMAKKKGWPNDTLADAVRAYTQAFKAEVEAGKGDTLVVSSEFFITLKRADFERLVAFLKPYAERIVVVCYVRHPAAAQVSVMAQRLKRSQARLDEAETGELSVNVADRLAKIVPVVGRENTILRAFATDALTKGDVVTDFMNVVGVPEAVMGKVRPVRANTSLSHEALLIADALSAITDKNEGGARVRNFEQAEVKAMQRIRGARYAFPAEVNKEILENARPVAARLEAEFGLKLKEPVLHEPQPLWSETAVEDIAQLIRDLLKHVDQDALLNAWRARDLEKSDGDAAATKRRRARRAGAARSAERDGPQPASAP